MNRQLRAAVRQVKRRDWFALREARKWRRVSGFELFADAMGVTVEQLAQNLCNGNSENADELIKSMAPYRSEKQ